MLGQILSGVLGVSESAATQAVAGSGSSMTRYVILLLLVGLIMFAAYYFVKQKTASCEIVTDSSHLNARMGHAEAQISCLTKAIDLMVEGDDGSLMEEDDNVTEQSAGKKEKNNSNLSADADTDDADADIESVGSDDDDSSCGDVVNDSKESVLSALENTEKLANEPKKVLEQSSNSIDIDMLKDGCCVVKLKSGKRKGMYCNRPSVNEELSMCSYHSPTQNHVSEKGSVVNEVDQPSEEKVEEQQPNINDTEGNNSEGNGNSDE